MNKVKGSFLVKALVHIVLFLLGLTILIGTYNIFMYLESYSTNDTTFTETSEFQNKYLKYVERVAVYIDYREKGFSGRVGYDSSSLDLSALYEKEKKRPDSSKSISNTDDFEYYNAILNNVNSNFLYYVRNLKTGAVYYSQSLKDTVVAKSKDDDSLDTMDAYLQSVKLNPAYLIINTETERYFTNVNRNHKLLNDENLNWVMDYITGNSAKNSKTLDSYRGDYILCVSIVDGFPNSSDEFGSMYKQFQELHYNYKLFLYPVPISFVFLLLFFVIAVAFTGHKKGIQGVVLTSFDRLYTEVGFTLVAVGILCLCVLAFYLGELLNDDFHLKINYIIIIAYTIVYPFCMFGLLSLIRRCKANLIFHNSLFYIGCCKFISFIKDFFAQRNLTYRIAILLLIFAVIQFLTFNAYRHHVYSDIRVPIVVIILDYIFLSYVLFKAAIDYNILRKETKILTEGDLNHKIPISNMCTPARTLGEYINNIGDGFSAAVDEKLKSEHLKTELITNVSHDIKTPLTSIINYVDLLKKENLENETAAGYLDVLSAKSWRLKTLIEDLVEASKASSGTLSMNLECLNLVELVRQSVGEFQDRFISHNLETILNIEEESIFIMADGRSTYRIIENIFSNANKYALSGTRVYVDITTEAKTVSVSVKNISANKLNIHADELMERFVRGDLSRNTEGSGLGLSIAKSLADLQDATFDIILDGDLFKAVIRFHRIEQPPKDSILREQIDTTSQEP